jgi:hypothetical protein
VIYARFLGTLIVLISSPSAMLSLLGLKDDGYDLEAWRRISEQVGLSLGDCCNKSLSIVFRSLEY